MLVYVAKKKTRGLAPKFSQLFATVNQIKFPGFWINLERQQLLKSVGDVGTVSQRHPSAGPEIIKKKTNNLAGHTSATLGDIVVAKRKSWSQIFGKR